MSTLDTVFAVEENRQNANLVGRFQTNEIVIGALIEELVAQKAIRSDLLARRIAAKLVEASKPYKP